MADRRTLDRRIKNLRRTRQVTYAMQLIASIKLKRVQKDAERGQRYWQELADVLNLLPGESAAPAPRRHLLVVIATDRGFAGNANQLLADFLRGRLDKDGADRPDETIAVGRHAARILTAAGLPPSLTVSVPDAPVAADLMSLEAVLEERLAQEPALAIDVMSLRFHSFAKQVPAETPLWPVARPKGTADRADYLFEPPAKAVAVRVQPRLLAASLLVLLREAKASEHAIRMRAMRQATESADEMLATLQIQRSRLRQQKITQEILEIVADAAIRRNRNESGKTDA